MASDLTPNTLSFKNPKGYMKERGFGTKSKMTKKFKKEKDRAEAIGFLKAQAEAK